MLSPVKSGSGELVIAVIRDITRRDVTKRPLRDSAERMKDPSRRLIEVQEAERRNIASSYRRDRQILGPKLTRDEQPHAGR